MKLKCRKCSYIVSTDFDTVEDGIILVCSHCGQWHFVHLYPTEKDLILNDKYEKQVEMGYENQLIQRENLNRWQKFMDKFEVYMDNEFNNKKEN